MTGGRGVGLVYDPDTNITMVSGSHCEASKADLLGREPVAKPGSDNESAEPDDGLQKNDGLQRNKVQDPESGGPNRRAA